MKRNYVTPAIAVEHYNLTQSIAACNIKINSLDEACVLNDSDSTEQMRALAYSNMLFADLCAKQAQGMDGEDGICYHTNISSTFVS